MAGIIKNKNNKDCSHLSCYLWCTCIYVNLVNTSSIDCQKNTHIFMNGNKTDSSQNICCTTSSVDCSIKYKMFSLAFSLSSTLQLIQNLKFLARAKTKQELLGQNQILFKLKLCGLGFVCFCCQKPYQLDICQAYHLFWRGYYIFNDTYCLCYKMGFKHQRYLLLQERLSVRVSVILNCFCDYSSGLFTTCLAGCAFRKRSSFHCCVRII